MNPVRECPVCFETKDIEQFQSWALSKNCNHIPSFCLDCVGQSINSQVQDVTANAIRCPECQAQLGYDVIQQFASEELFTQFHRRGIERLISRTNNFIWCPLGCEGGHNHDLGANQPLAFCLADSGHFCFRHRIAWHQDYTCEEYDAYLADPQNFRSRAQIEREQHRERELELRRSHQVAQNFNDEFELMLLREAEATEARRQARIEEEHRIAEENARREEEERMAEEARQHQKRLRKEEMATEQALPRLSQNCPECRIPVQKNGGCNHLICYNCGRDFNWTVPGRYRRRQ